jgi:hypothetical protein
MRSAGLDGEAGEGVGEPSLRIDVALAGKTRTIKSRAWFSPRTAYLDQAVS